MSEVFLEVMGLRHPSYRRERGTAGSGPCRDFGEGGRDEVHGYLAY